MCLIVDRAATEALRAASPDSLRTAYKVIRFSHNGIIPPYVCSPIFGATLTINQGTNYALNITPYGLAFIDGPIETPEDGDCLRSGVCHLCGTLEDAERRRNGLNYDLNNTHALVKVSYLIEDLIAVGDSGDIAVRFYHISIDEWERITLEWLRWIHRQSAVALALLDD